MGDLNVIRDLEIESSDRVPFLKRARFSLDEVPAPHISGDTGIRYRYVFRAATEIKVHTREEERHVRRQSIRNLSYFIYGGVISELEMAVREMYEVLPPDEHAPIDRLNKVIKELRGLT